MNDKNIYSSSKPTSDPASRNYSKEVNNKAHEKSPFGTDEPSPRTTFKNKRH
jgi:hypothetical protein